MIDGKPVEESMIRADRITRIDLSPQRGADPVRLKELLDLLAPGLTRIPAFDEGGSVRYVIHQSLLYRFISQRSIAAGAANQPLDVAGMTLADLVVAPDIGPLVRDAIAFVPRKATLGEAKAKMDGTPNCQDVFVTVNGVRGEPVEGWLTNVEIGRRAAP